MVPAGSEPRAGLKPRWVQRTVAMPAGVADQSPHRVGQRHGVVGAHLHQQVAARPAVLEPVGGERRQGRGSPAGHSSGRPTASKRPGPKPKVTVNRDGNDGSSGSSAPSGGCADISRSASSLSSRSSRRTPSASVPGRRSRPRNTACACVGRVVMPGWWGPWKATVSRPASAGLFTACRRCVAAGRGRPTASTAAAVPPTAVAAPPNSRVRRRSGAELSAHPPCPGAVVAGAVVIGASEVEVS